jgi:hypothetical protein
MLYYNWSQFQKQPCPKIWKQFISLNLLWITLIHTSLIWPGILLHLSENPMTSCEILTKSLPCPHMKYGVVNSQVCCIPCFLSSGITWNKPCGCLKLNYLHYSTLTILTMCIWHQKKQAQRAARDSFTQFINLFPMPLK